jgi:pilus assembly protein CpaD
MTGPNRLLACVALGLTLAGCGPAELRDYDHRQRFPLSVESRTASATLARADDAVAPSPDDLLTVRRLAEEFLRRGSAPASLVVGAKDAADPAAAAYGQAVVEAFAAAGADVSKLSASVSSEAQPGPGKAVLKVPVWVAKVPECGRWEDEYTPDFSNKDSDNFGCSVTRNTGLMVSNPADLVRAREATGRMGARSADVLEKYFQGKSTGSDKEKGDATSTMSSSGSK